MRLKIKIIQMVSVIILGCPVFISQAFAQLNNITVFATPLTISNNYETAAYQFGKLLGQQKRTLIYGADATGIMGAVLKGARESKATIVNVSTSAEDQLKCPPNESCLQQQVELKETPALQQQSLFETGDALVILPGGWDMMYAFATYAVQVENGEYKKKPVIFLNINHYWDNLRYQLDEMKRQKMITEDQTDYIAFVDKPRDVFKEMTRLKQKMEKNIARGITDKIILPTDKGTVTIHYK